ncbi:hypothetical protein G51EAM_00144 [Candidatus Nanoperiomorbus periodonticus]|nr:hypothetical protein G51EAM_00144 [Candidatus Nanoperiomorbus periodonticus]
MVDFGQAADDAVALLVKSGFDRFLDMEPIKLIDRDIDIVVIDGIRRSGGRGPAAARATRIRGLGGAGRASHGHDRYHHENDD